MVELLEFYLDVHALELLKVEVLTPAHARYVRRRADGLADIEDALGAPRLRAERRAQDDLLAQTELLEHPPQQRDIQAHERLAGAAQTPDEPPLDGLEVRGAPIGQGHRVLDPVGPAWVALGGDPHLVDGGSQVACHRHRHPNGSLGRTDAVPVLEVVLPELSVVEHHEHVREAGLMEEAQPGDELRLMDRDAHC